MTNQNNSINYIELPLFKLTETKSFYSNVFGWEFTEWSPNYISFSGAGIDGGFNGEEGVVSATSGVLIVLYSNDLAITQQSIINSGGKITKETYQFPGGQRFHFQDPNGNELAVWSDK